MKIPSIIKQAQKFIDDNGPVILTAAGMIGVGVTAVLTHKAAKDTTRVLDLAVQSGTFTEEPTHKELAQVFLAQGLWKNYVAPVTAGVATAGCMFFATKINLQRLTTLGAVYALSDGNFKEYKAKVEQKLGAKEASAIRDEVNKDKVKQNPPTYGENMLVIPESGKQLCMEAYTGRYFLSNIEDIKSAQNRLNFYLVQEGTASLSEFYDYLGLPKTAISENIGWQVGPNNQGMQLDFTSTLTEKGEPVLVVDYLTIPFLDFDN